MVIDGADVLPLLLDQIIFTSDSAAPLQRLLIEGCKYCPLNKCGELSIWYSSLDATSTKIMIIVSSTAVISNNPCCVEKLSPAPTAYNISSSQEHVPLHSKHRQKR